MRLDAVIQWLPFSHGPGAARDELRARGREASRAAFRAAAAAWRHAYGEAPWLEAAIAHDADGAPLVAGHAGAPGISIAHARGLAGCAIAAPGARCPGIDCEPLDAPAAAALRELSVQTGESALPWSDEAWPLRLWCAKESVVKAERGGADALGRMLRVEHVSAEHGGVQLVTVRSHRDRVFTVATAVVGAHVRAWTA